MAGRTMMRNELPSDPRVLAMSAHLETSVTTVVGACMIFWAYADAHAQLCHGPGCTCDSRCDVTRDVTRDDDELLIACRTLSGRIGFLTPGMLDKMTDLPGFTAAMESVKWLTIEAAAILVPRYGDHCGSPQKKRLSDRLRQRRLRERKRLERQQRAAAAPKPRRLATVTRDTGERHTEIASSSASSSAPASSKVVKSNDLQARTPDEEGDLVRSRYGFTGEQVAEVSRLVDQQLDILGSGDTNRAFYLKRAAEAVQSSDGNLLERTLGDFKQAAATIAVMSRPKYFHAMYLEAQQRESRDPRARLIADAEKRGFTVPPEMHVVDMRQVNLWWASLEQRKPPHTATPAPPAQQVAEA